MRVSDSYLGKYSLSARDLPSGRSAVPFSSKAHAAKIDYLWPYVVISCSFQDLCCFSRFMRCGIISIFSSVLSYCCELDFIIVSHFNTFLAGNLGRRVSIYSVSLLTFNFLYMTFGHFNRSFDSAMATNCLCITFQFWFGMASC